MTTQSISFSYARKNLAELWQKAQKEKIQYEVFLNSKPVFSLIPKELEEDELQNFSALSEKSFEFWKGKEDDIFMNCNAIG